MPSMVAHPRHRHRGDRRRSRVAGRHRGSPVRPTDTGAAGWDLALTMNPLLRIESLVRDFGTGDGSVRALDGVTLSFERGSFTAVMGPSGSGKSTLLQSAAGLDRPTAGRVFLGDVELSGLGERALAKLRRERLGYVFQSFNLLA